MLFVIPILAGQTAEAWHSGCHGTALMITNTNTNTTMVDWVRLIRAEYLEIPGLTLTRTQVRRLWGLDDATCDVVLDALVESRFLKQARNHCYLRSGASV